jgi:putative radical SAM enzyme (TIGR03279 family)
MIKVCSSQEPRIPQNAMLIAINNQNIDDILEYRFYNDQSKTRCLLFEYQGKKTELVFGANREITIQLDAPVYRHCKNDCDFCFIRGLPQGMRKELYFRDDDYRLSFMFGNFLSLTNISPDDIKRIARLRLSPLYISVHSTNPELRKKLFKNDRAGLIMEQLRSLIDNNIKLHCQIVVIPGLNDGVELIKTINDLSELHPVLSSIGIVPVGRTKYLKNTPALSRYQAKEIIASVMNLHKIFKTKYHRGLVYLADEFFINTQTNLPTEEYYDDFPQYENGIGIARSFLSEVERLITKRKIHGHYLFLTGVLALPIIRELKIKLQNLGCIKDNIVIDSITNNFFGTSVTVSGLLSAEDFIAALKRINAPYNKIFLPPNCTNDSNQFLDSVPIEDERIIVAPKNLEDLVQCLQ